MGKIVSSTVEQGRYDIPFTGEWLENIDGGIRLTRQASPHVLGRLNVGVIVNTSTVNPPGLTYEYTAKKVAAALLDATLQINYADVLHKNDRFLAEIGYFPFKYSPQSTNLGEYLFRSGTYPGYLVSGFEHSIDKPKLGGVHLQYQCDALGTLKQDLVLNTELDVFPYHDINMTYLATHEIGPVFNLSAGVQLARLISVDPRKTTLGLDTIYHNRYDPKIGYIDTASNDTILYTFKGTKIVGRAMLDFKELVAGFGGALPFMGKNDLQLYTEAAILGVKNYPGWYNNIKERVPVMVGFNLPAFKLLDVLSVEVERYQSPYWNSQEYIWKGDSPIPYISSGTYPNYDRDWNSSMAKTDDDIKWSVYASKKLGKIMRISAQAASDHTPRNWYTPWPAPQSAKYTDMVPRTKDWYYMMRVSFYF
ncbi:MAG: hypothetical protein MUF22_00905 [Chitinispirillaceae bacterium]|nr:hypothetical protein [Chitinispirillaceae bacterium]